MVLRATSSEGKKLLKQFNKSPNGFKVTVEDKDPYTLRLACHNRNMMRWFTPDNIRSMLCNFGGIREHVDYEIEGKT